MDVYWAGAARWPACATKSTAVRATRGNLLVNGGPWTIFAPSYSPKFVVIGLTTVVH